jgi:hypothetical protein
MLGRIGLVLAVAFAGSSAAPKASLAQDGAGLAHPASAYYRSAGRTRVVRGPQVRGFQQRRVGGYSFSSADTVNTYGNVRTQFGGNNVYRDLQADRQTRFGPFDHGFFFDSGVGVRGGYSPYHN